MAVFLLKTRERDGSGYTYAPPPCTGIFNDVPCPSGFAVNWIEEVPGGDHRRLRWWQLLSLDPGD